MRGKRSVAAVLAVLSVFVATWAFTAPIEIKLGHVDAPDNKKGVASLVFKDIVEAGSGGAIKVSVFPSGQLGAERELIEGTKMGTVQMCMVSAALAGFFKEAQVLDIPYLFSSAPVAWKVLDGKFGRELGDECLKKTGMRLLAYGETGFRNFTSSTKLIKSPEDLKGQKIRVMESPVYMTLIKALGGSPTPIAWTETYSALQQKVVDGQENPVSAIMMAKLYEVQKYVTLDGHTYGADFILINDEVFKKLTPDQQRLLVTAARVGGVCGRANNQQMSAAGIAELKKKGLEVYQPTDAELAKFRDATQKPVIEYLEKQVGKPWIEKALAAVKEAEAELK